MKEAKKYRIIIGGGGTGGHVFPAISIANAIGNALGDAVEFLFVGALGKIEMEKVPEAGYEIIGLPVAGFQRKITMKNVSFFFRLIRSMQISRKVVRTFDPHLAIGVGGYASGPIVKAAAKRKVPVVLQEQNSYAGVTNRILARSAEKICVAYKGMERYFPGEKIILTGNPIRQDLVLPDAERTESFRHFGLDPSRKVLLMIGGSGGARTLNESVMQHIREIAASGAQLIWQSGKYYYETAMELLKGSEAANIILLPFIREMNRAFQVADVIISRAGAGTISELCVIGKPVILVPSPNVAEDHQTRNARSLTDEHAGILVHDQDAVEELMATALQLLEDEQEKALLSKNIQKLALPDASDRIAGEAIKILKRT